MGVKTVQKVHYTPKTIWSKINNLAKKKKKEGGPTKSLGQSELTFWVVLHKIKKNWVVLYKINVKNGADQQYITQH